ncbi:MAG: FHA domain-containing protein [Xanthomonadales bacterium]|nr:FHA domain-containing protein [Xanthomonadales bacterium]
MEAVIFIERLGKHGEVLQRSRHEVSESSPLRIGRGWEADYWLPDEYVSLAHAQIEIDAARGLILRDLETRNGLIDRRGAAHREVVLGAENDIILGKTRLRVVVAGGAQPEAVALPRRQPGMLLRALGWLALATGVSWFGDWLNQFEEVRAGAVATALIVGLFVLIAWSASWALLTRLFAFEMRFARHLRVASIGSLIATVLMMAHGYLVYALSADAIDRYDYVVFWLLFGGVCLAHLRVLGSGHTGLKTAVALGLAVLAIGVQSLNLMQPRGMAFQQPRFAQAVAPPAFRLVPTETVDEFVLRAASLESALQEARVEALSEDGAGEGDDIDFVD